MKDMKKTTTAKPAAKMPVKAAAKPPAVRQEKEKKGTPNKKFKTTVY